MAQHAIRKVNPIDDQLWFFKKAYINPKPTKVIT
jgi:hypothetical protein